jgi:branched-chain amino acid transport system permease protein
MFWVVRLGSIIAALAGCFALDAIVRAQNNEFTTRLVVLAGLYVTLAVSLNLINGITGQFSIGHAAFYQVGAYTAGYVAIILNNNPPMGAVPWVILMMFAGAAVAAIAGLVVGLPSLRLRGDYLAIVTLGFGEIIRIVSQNIEFVRGGEKIGGPYGFNFGPKVETIWLVWLLAIVCIAVCRNLLKTAHGLPFLAVREDEVASAAMGVNVTRVKVAAFVLGSAFAGAAGALLAHNEGFTSPATFNMSVSFIILTMVVLGGTGSITGSAIAAALLFYLPELLRQLPPVSGSSLVAGAIAVFAATFAVKKIGDEFHGSLAKKTGLILGAIIAAVILQIIFAMILKSVPKLATTRYEADQLRMVFFAATLIILMLVRPQGVFAHHEFSWSWVQRLLGRSAPTKEVAA